MLILANGANPDEMLLLANNADPDEMLLLANGANPDEMLLLANSADPDEMLLLANSADPDEMPHNAKLHLGLHCLLKYPFRGFQSKRVKVRQVSNIQMYVCVKGAV